MSLKETWNTRILIFSSHSRYKNGMKKSRGIQMIYMKKGLMMKLESCFKNTEKIIILK